MNTMKTIDRIQVVAFGAMAVIAAYGIVKGAWWHIGTLAICLTVVKASMADIKKEEGKA